MTKETTRGQSYTPPTPWVIAAVCAWALLFALVSFYWAAGGTVAAHTVAAQPEKLATPGELWLIGVVKLFPLLLVLALAWRGISGQVRRLLRAACGIAGALLILYGAADFIDHGLMAAGLIHTPVLLGRRAVWWHLALWDPWWLIGGVLLVLLARSERRGQA